MTGSVGQADNAVIREKTARLMLKHSIATGHGDTVNDLLGELDFALTEMRRELLRLHQSAQKYLRAT